MANSVPDKHHEIGSKMILGDRLSDLPDHLLQHILTLLPTKDAIATSSLSKSWNSLWIRLCTLQFDDSTFSSSKSFDQFVESSLRFFSSNFNHIKIFRLKCGIFSIHSGTIISWLIVINRLKVKELELCFESWFSIILPSGILNCNTMKVLKLKGVEVSTFYPVNLPSLEVLDLESVKFHTFKCFLMLLIGCPILQELKLSSFAIYRTKDIESSLQHLVSSSNPLFLVTLKEFCIDKFKGFESEYRIARFIMENAKDLKTISIICRTSVNSTLVVKKLSSCRRASENCRILFQFWVPSMTNRSVVKFQSCNLG